MKGMPSNTQKLLDCVNYECIDEVDWERREIVVLRDCRFMDGSCEFEASRMDHEEVQRHPAQSVVANSKHG